MNGWISLLAAGVAASAAAAGIDPVSLLTRVQSKVLDSAKTIPRYVCRQNIERQDFVPREKPPAACGKLPEPVPSNLSGLDFVFRLATEARLALVSSDRATLDVMLTEDAELFSWPGGGHFDTNDPAELLAGGFSGSGDFSSFVITVFSEGQVTFQYLGSCGSDSCVRYRFDVPLPVSRYVVKTGLKDVPVGYHGSFDVDPQSGDLLTMTVIPTDLSTAVPTACDLRTRMTYARTTMNASEFTIPDRAEREYLRLDGRYFSDSIEYTGCRQYTAQSALTFGDVSGPEREDQGKSAVAVPRAGTTLELRLASKVDSELSSAGDGLEAALVRAVPAANGRMIPAGTTVRGRLTQVEKIFAPKPAVTFSMKLDTIVLDGAPVPLTLVPAGKQDLRGGAVFQFPQPRVALDSSFISRWRVR